MRWFALTLAITLAGCIDSGLSRCASGRICGLGFTCDNEHDTCVNVANARLKEALGVADDARKKAEAANTELKRVNAAQEAELKKLRKANRPF